MKLELRCATALLVTQKLMSVDDWMQLTHNSSPTHLFFVLQQNNGHKLRWVVSTGTGAARGSYYIRVMTWISHGSTSRLNKVLKWYQHICPVGSKRNQYGRYGLLFHTFEFGSYYHMLLPRPVKEWIVKTKRRVVMTAENGRNVGRRHLGFL